MARSDKWTRAKANEALANFLHTHKDGKAFVETAHRVWNTLEQHMDTFQQGRLDVNDYSELVRRDKYAFIDCMLPFVVPGAIKWTIELSRNSRARPSRFEMPHPDDLDQEVILYFIECDPGQADGGPCLIASADDKPLAIAHQFTGKEIVFRAGTFGLYPGKTTAKKTRGRSHAKNFESEDSGGAITLRSAFVRGKKGFPRHDDVPDQGDWKWLSYFAVPRNALDDFEISVLEMFIFAFLPWRCDVGQKHSTRLDSTMIAPLSSAIPLSGEHPFFSDLAEGTRNRGLLRGASLISTGIDFDTFTIAARACACKTALPSVADFGIVKDSNIWFEHPHVQGTIVCSPKQDFWPSFQRLVEAGTDQPLEAKDVVPPSSAWNARSAAARWFVSLYGSLLPQQDESLILANEIVRKLREAVFSDPLTGRCQVSITKQDAMALWSSAEIASMLGLPFPDQAPLPMTLSQPGKRVAVTGFQGLMLTVHRQNFYFKGTRVSIPPNQLQSAAVWLEGSSCRMYCNALTPGQLETFELNDWLSDESKLPELVDLVQKYGNKMTELVNKYPRLSAGYVRTGA